MTEMTRTEPRWLSHRYSGEERRRRVLRRGSRHGRHCVEGYGCVTSGNFGARDFLIRDLIAALFCSLGFSRK